MNLNRLFDLILIIIASAMMLGCDKEYRPNSNTLEHKLEHGHVEGAINKLWVGNTLLKISPNIHYNPVTSGNITPGKADQVYFGIRYPQFEPSNTLNSVSIMVRGGGYENPEVWDENFKEKKWKKIVERKDLNLIEYHLDVKYTARGYIVYVPIDSSFRTPKGSLIRYSCSGNENGIVSCLSSFVLEKDLYVQYKITKSLLPHWKKIHLDVVDYIDDMIVRSGE